ncbi:MAG: hypothetical protein GY849_20780, partial [Deltaproteobacteria bacterium]|nr:hypothetical protein [Deltaproteobacteria bacterium]
DSASTHTEDYGTLSIQSDGSYTYVVDAAAVNALQAGENASDTYTLLVKDPIGDSDTTTITFNVTGENDTPIVDTTYSHTIMDTSGKDSFADITGNVSAADSDDATLTWSIDSTSTHTEDYGTLSIQADGSYTYVVDAAAVNALQAGENASDTYTLLVKDPIGDSDTTTITFNVTGDNDAPIVDNTYSHTIMDTSGKDTFADITGSVSAADSDDATLTWSI